MARLLFDCAFCSRMELVNVFCIVAPYKLLRWCFWWQHRNT